MPTPSPNPYALIGRDRPNLPRVGGTYIGITETVAGHEREFNRWYEDDHFYSGAMAGPWVLAGRRWVATHALRQTWIPEDSPIISPDGQGCYFKAYWFAEGHEDDAELWMNEAFEDLQTPDRFPTMRFGAAATPRVQRLSRYSSFQRHLFTCSRDGGPMGAVHALDYPFAGLALDVVRLDGEPADLVAALEPAVQAELGPARSPIAVCFERSSNQWLPSAAPQHDGELIVLWFFEDAPGDEGYSVRLADFHRAIRTAGARLALSASFVPTLPGTDAYVDELRAP